MFDGNIKGNMELNNLKLSEIRQDISTRRLANQVSGKSWLGTLVDRIKLSSRLVNAQSESASIETQPSEKVRSS